MNAAKVLVQCDENTIERGLATARPEFNALDVVVLLVTLPASEGRPECQAGSVGTVLEVFVRPNLAYLVEFLGVTGDWMERVVHPAQITRFAPHARVAMCDRDPLRIGRQELE